MDDVHVARGWLKEVITLGQFILKGCAKVPQLQMKAQSVTSIKVTRCRGL